MKLFFAITILFFGYIRSVFTQCEGVYIYDLAPDELFNIDISMINKIDTSECEYTISVDTTYDHRYPVVNVPEPEFYVETINMGKTGYNYFVVNEETKQRFEMGPIRYDFENYRTDIISTSEFIFKQNAKTTSLFYYKTNEIKYYKFPLFDIVGYDEEYVFLLLKEKFKFEKNYYFTGSIFRFDGDVLQVVEPQKDADVSSKMEYLIFLNSIYRVENILLKEEYIDCKMVNYFASKIYFNNHLIDSTTFKSENAITEMCEYNNDTLYMYNRFESREFINGVSTVRSNISDTLKQQPVIQEFVVRYINLQIFYTYYNNYLIALMHLDPRDEKGFIPGTKTTNNGIELNDKCRRYDLVLLFDKRDLKFLGYPEIVFGSW